MKESPIFTRTHDLVLWLYIVTRKFPRQYRFTLAQELTAKATALEDAETAAALDDSRARDHLLAADIALSGLRKRLLTSHELGCLDAGQYRHASEMVAEIGRLLGGWRKSRP